MMSSRGLLMYKKSILTMYLNGVIGPGFCCNNHEEQNGICVGDVQSNICYNNSRNGVIGPGFCCNNHEEQNGICVECDIGYVSKDGLPCKPCSLGLWGRKCRNVCSCQHNESCNNMFGCVERTTVVPEKWESTFNEPNESTHVLTTAAAEKNDGIFLRSEIIIYSISAGSIAVMVALASCCLKNKRKTEHLNKSKSPTPHHIQVSSDQTNFQFNNDSSTYDSIDEDNMICNDTCRHSIISIEHVNQAGIRFSTNVDQDVSSSSYFEGDVTDPSNESNSDPCKPMLEVDVHGYRLSVGESTQKPEKISLESSEKGMSDAPRINNGSQNTVGKQIFTPLKSGLQMTATSDHI